MRYLSAMSIIFAVTLLAELLHHTLTLPVPACVYGLVLMLLALQFRIVALPKVRSAARLLIEWLPLMFIPPTVGLLVTGEQFRSMLLPLLVISIVTTVVVAGVTGWIAQGLIRFQKRRGKSHDA